MKITAQDLLKLKIIDGIVEEPLGGAHRGREDVILSTGKIIKGAFDGLHRSNMDFREQRREKFLAIGRSL
jgi:acetyl-CoA carboxylase carboxyl transferase subunit alpha